MHLATVHSTGSAHVGYDAEECAILKQAESVHAGLAANHGISAALKGGLHAWENANYPVVKDVSPGR